LENTAKSKKSNRLQWSESEEELYKIIKEQDEKIKKNSKDIDAIRTKAVSLHKLSRTKPELQESAIEYFDKVLQLDPNDKISLKRKGMLLLRNETIEEAKECFDKVIKLDPSDTEAWWGKGTAFQVVGKPYQAIQYFDNALEIDPYDALVLKQKGLALSARRETWDNALECFDKALGVNLDDPGVWKGKAEILHKKNDLDGALICYGKAQELKPRDGNILIAVGFALTGKNEFEKAIDAFDKSLTLNRNNVEALRGKGDALYFLGKYTEAIKMFDEIIKLNPKYSDAWRQKGFCFLNLNKKKQALDNFESALELNPEDIKSQQEYKKLLEEGIKSSKPFTKNLDQIDYSEYAIFVNGLSKSFKIYHEKHDSVFSVVSNAFSKNRFEVLNVLDDITFGLKKGEMLGVIGKNGHGKTTLLKILAGILRPDSGEIKINGSVAPLLQLGVGFNGELTAKENIILSGLLLGFTRKQIKEKVDKIIQFAELEKFADTKTKFLSSGMQARLAFSTTIQIDPDILLVDEILAVGDINFVKKSYREFLSFRERKKSIVFVSHSLEHIKNLCDRVILLDEGKIKIIGNPDDVTDYYVNMNKDQ